MADDQLTIEQFGQKIKAAHPEYADMADADVGQKVLTKYPQYNDMVRHPASNPQPTASIGAVPAPMGIQGTLSKWLGDVESDVRLGQKRTLPGKVLSLLGAQGTDVGAQAGTQEQGLASPVLGPIKAAQGVTEGNPVKAVSGIAQSASLPAMLAGGPVLKGAAEAIPSAKYAGQVLGQVEEAAGKIPIKVAQVGDIALETKELAQSGGRMPKVINDFLRRVTDPELPAMTYAEARKFASNASRLSMAEKNNLTPVMQRQAARFASALSDSIGEAAGQAGQGERYAQAMTEYARAKAFQRLATNAGGLAAKGAVGGGLYYGVHELLGRR